MSTIMNVPQLRFSEFSGEWEDKKLNDILNLLTDFEANGSFANVKENVTTYNEKNYAWYVRATDLENNTPLESVKYVDKHSYDFLKKTPLFGDELLISKRGEIGKVYYFNPIQAIKATLAPNLYLLKLKDTVVPKFIYSYFINKEGNKKLKRINASSTIGALYKDDVKAIKLNIPIKQEQEKIASFLSSVDIKIEQLTSKVKLLQEYKKGMMQKIFSLEIRFRDDNGSDYSEWVERKLGDISDVRDGTHDSPKYYDDGFPLITSKNLLKNGSIDFNNVNLILEEDYKSINRRSKVSKGDILFGMIGTIGNPVLVNDEGFAIKNVALIKEKDLLQNYFLIQYLKSSLIEKQFYQQNTGGTQKFIALGVIRKLVIKTPSRKEQTKIANFLSSIDSKIEHVQKQLDSTKEFKKALLQQMFV